MVYTAYTPVHGHNPCASNGETAQHPGAPWPSVELRRDHHQSAAAGRPPLIRPYAGKKTCVAGSSVQDIIR